MVMGEGVSFFLWTKRLLNHPTKLMQPVCPRKELREDGRRASLLCHYGPYPELSLLMLAWARYSAADVMQSLPVATTCSSGKALQWCSERTIVQ